VGRLCAVLKNLQSAFQKGGVSRVAHGVSYLA
jgi:hypothetical protein